MSHIITRGLAGRTLITRGYGFTEFTAIIIKEVLRLQSFLIKSTGLESLIVKTTGLESFVTKTTGLESFVVKNTGLESFVNKDIDLESIYFEDETEGGE